MRYIYVMNSQDETDQYIFSGCLGGFEGLFR